MGNNNSLVQSQVPSKLKELSEVVLSAGDRDTARILRHISSSQELIKSWRTKLILDDLARGNSLAGSDMAKWFQVWKSNKGEELSSDQVCRLAALTKNWRRRHQQDIPQCLYDWISNPVSKFWGQRQLSPDTQLIDCCLNDIDETEGSPTMSPIRRRVILVILHDLIQQEKQRLRDEATQRKANSRGHPNSEKGKKFLTKAINNIINKTYRGHNLSQNVLDQKRKRCTELQRYGGRWSLFGRREAILEFPVLYAANNFERAKLEAIEIEALNAYEESMYDQGYRSKLQEAYNAIYNAYMSRRCKFPIWLNNPDNVKSHTTALDHTGQKRVRDNHGYTDGPVRKRPILITSRDQRRNAQSITPRLRSSDIDPTIQVQTGHPDEANDRMLSESILTIADTTGTCSTADSGTSAFPTCSQVNIPLAEPADAWAATTMMAHSGGFSHQPSSDIPQPDAMDAWAATETMAHCAGFSHHPSSDIPQPDAMDAWAAAEMMTHTEDFSHHPSSDIPQPDAMDAWAAAEMMTHTEDFSHHPSSDIPQPDAMDAWAAAEMMAHTEDFSHPSRTVSHAEAVDAWASSEVTAHSGGFSHQPSSDIPQPDAMDAWAATETMAHRAGFSHHPSSDIPRPDAADAWAAVGRVVEHLPASNTGRNSTRDPYVQADLSLFPPQRSSSNNAQNHLLTATSFGSNVFNHWNQGCLYQSSPVSMVV